MDQIRQLIAKNNLNSDSGIDGCSTSCGSSSQLNLPHTSNSEATSAIIDISDVQEDNPLTDDDGFIVSDDDCGGAVGGGGTAYSIDSDKLNDHQQENQHDQHRQRLSTDSGSTFELLDYQVEAEGSNNKECCHAVEKPENVIENSDIEERDSFSPNHPTDDDESECLRDPILGTLELGDFNNCSIDDDNNKLFQRVQANHRIRLSSKEEKQRQNEEIVIMESSSVSSETGSWESVFPQRSPSAEVTESCNVFIKNERHQSSAPMPLQDASQSARTATRELPDFSYTSKLSNPSVSACFIDASSLMDDTEVYSSLTGPTLPETGCCGPHPSSLSDENCQQNCCIKLTEKSSSEDLIDNPSQKVVDKKGTEIVTPVSTPDLQSPNLSDEQKLLHRGSEQRIEYDIKDQFSIEADLDPKLYVSPCCTAEEQPSTVDYSQDEGVVVTTSSSEKSESDSKFRKDQERKQGNFLFKNSIQHYSGHVLTPKNSYIDRDDNFSDLSLPSMHSTSSDQYTNDYANNVLETCSQYSSNYGDTTSEIGGESRAVSDAESGFFPDTPHNSIVHIESPPRSMSIASPDIIGALRIPKRVFKCDESAPIVSGGASIKDFSPRLCESPSVRRKTETCPILSGGLLIEDFQDMEKPKPIVKPKISSTSTWVVDMSDCNTKSSWQQRSESSSSDNTTASIERSGSSSSHKSGMGFYVSLSDMEGPKDPSSVKGKKTLNETSSQLSESVKSTKFFVDMTSESSVRSQSASPKVVRQQDGLSSNEASNEVDKNNIFSIFIDFGEKKVIPVKEPSAFTSRLSSSLRKQKELDSQNQSDSESINGDKTKFDGSTIVRRNHSAAALSEKKEYKRHSWNTPKEKPVEKHSREYSRSASLSSTGDSGIMNILDKIPLISKASSMSVESPISPLDDFTCSKSISSYSNNSNSLTSNSIHSSIESKVKGDNMPDIMTASTKKRRQDVNINETFDKSSQGSLTDGVLSKDSSPTTDTDDITFQNDVDPDTVARNATMETIIETKETASPKKLQIPVLVNKITSALAPPSKLVETHTMETLQATIEKQKLLLETVNEEVQLSSFVKLSDMDKPAPKFELHSNETLSKSVGSTTRIGRLFTDSRTSGSRNSWHTMSRSTGNNLTNLASSVENLKSLSRLFPHLSKELSNSLPADIQIDDAHNNKSPSVENQEYIHTDLSCTSSLTSSFSRSGIDSADESSLSCRQPRRLGEDLLKMFLQEIATDVILEVGGRRMRAHKCILRSRCQYFAAILAGNWVQSSGNVISLPGYSYGSVHFALCHIYSGASHPPEGISLMELSALADLLGLEGLKEVTAHALRTNYCHNFHKPCSGCIEGILQVFPVTLNHGLDDLYRKCLRWACKHYVKVWPTRAFAQLPADIIGRCKQHVVAHLTSESVLTTILDCDHLLTLLAPCRWAIGVENTVRDVIDTAHSYIADHFASLIASDGFLSLGHGQSWNISRLENLLLRIGSTLTPEQACRTYQRITRLNAVLGARVLKLSSSGMRIEDGIVHEDHEEEMDWNPEFLSLVGSILSAVEQCLTRQCARAMRHNQWQRMDLELRKKIQKLACLSDPVGNSRRPKSQTQNKMLNHSSSTSNSSSRNQDLHQVKLAIQAHSKRAQENMYQYRASAHTQTNYYDRIAQTIDKSVQANHEPRSMERGKVSKTSSNSHVPDLISTIKSKERPTSLGHRRSQSETINTKIYKHSIPSEVTTTTTVKTSHNALSAAAATTTTVRLSDVRPRYLEPRQPRSMRNEGVTKTASTLSVNKKNHISSSDSSTRNSSPALNKRATGKSLKNNDSTNMSRDSLASPAKHNKAIKNKNVNDFDISIDSLGDSLKSSIKTDKTLSQESLAPMRNTLTKPTTASSLKAHTFSRSNPVINKEQRPQNNLHIGNKLLAKNNALSCQTTSENSPSSATTNKSSRLSSVTSAVSSPRESYNSRRSLSTPQSSASSVPMAKKSFLSAKSREILAAKKTITHTESSSSVPGMLKSKVAAANPVNKSSSTSNITTGRRPFSTTLHLRRTAKITNGVVNTEKKAAVVAVTNKCNKTKVEKKIDKIKVEIEKDEKQQYGCSMRIESKLERSSTFCKEVSDIPNTELQIIE